MYRFFLIEMNVKNELTAQMTILIYIDHKTINLIISIDI